MSWIDLKVRKPTAKDADKNEEVLQMLENGYVVSWHWSCLEDAVAWMPIPKFTPVADPPEGYEFLRDYDATPDPQAVWLDGHEWRQRTLKPYHRNAVYAVPIKPSGPPEPPEGYRLVDTNKEQFSLKAKVWAHNYGKWIYTSDVNDWTPNLHYAVPIKPPELQYRSFANAEEFRPFRDRWWRFKNEQTLIPPQRYCDKWHSQTTWMQRFKKCEFEDGTPFGLPVD